MSASELERIIEEQHIALDAFVKGDDEPLAQLWSREDDVTLGNPFGPFVRGFAQVADAMKRAASHYRDGEASGFNRLSKHATPDLACIVEEERFNAKIGGRPEIRPISLRCTSVFRREDGAWRLVHRHADPIMSAQPPDSLIQD